MVSVAYLVPGTGLKAEELERRERIANDLTAADISILEADRGPMAIESEVEHEWCVPGVLELIAEHEADYDAFVIGCFGDPGIEAARELTDRPVVGPAASTFHTAAQIADQFSCLTIRSTPASKRRQIHRDHLSSQLSSVRVVDLGVLDIDHSSDAIVDEMIDEATAAVEDDGAEAVVPGCMSLAFMQVHNDIASELGVPFLDPATISLETATMWGRHGIQHSRLSYPSFDDSRYETLFD